MKGKRTGLDFSKHEVVVIENDHVTIHKLQRPDTIQDSIYFINSCGIMSVTGDYGNWIFCRSFIPSATSDGVSDGYWLEKLRNSSCQQPGKYCSEKTAELIRKELEEENDLSEEEKEYLNDMLECVEDEHQYLHRAFDESVGRYNDFEYVPIGKEQNVWLNYIFDGFDEICRRMKEEHTPKQ